MADNGQQDRPAAAAEPPGGGRQDHDVMRAASMRPISGPASTDTVAAIGGGDVPGREPHPELAERALRGDGVPAAHPHEPIPGERDPGNLTHREPGAVGGQFAGADIPSGETGWALDEQTSFEHALEGGGDAARRARRTRNDK
jgi:hypothetical protein